MMAVYVDAAGAAAASAAVRRCQTPGDMYGLVTSSASPLPTRPAARALEQQFAEAALEQDEVPLMALALSLPLPLPPSRRPSPPLLGSARLQGALLDAAARVIAADLSPPAAAGEQPLSIFCTGCAPLMLRSIGVSENSSLLHRRGVQ
jgi:hypothetical protein